MVSRRQLTRLTGGAVLCAASPALRAAPLQAAPLVEEWIKRLNALADWTKDGESQRQVSNFIELFDPEVLQFTGPNEDQIGMATYSGIEGIRVWAERFGRAWMKSEYQIKVDTAQEKTTGLLYVTEPPWGGIAVSVELLTLCTARKTKKRFAMPGAAFLQFTEQGKIRRARLYLLKDELAEVHP